MRIDTWLTQTTSQLRATGSTTARLDCLVLLEDCLNTNRTQLLAHPEQLLTAEQLTVLNVHIERRSHHEPLAYIRGKTEFYGREFRVDHRVLEPRPESETMVDLLQTLTPDEHAVILDIGTGSGALAISAKLAYPQATVLASDIDPACLAVARHNAGAYRASIEFIQSDLLQSRGLQARQPSIILANLPYVPDDAHINTAAAHEPRLAIFGGSDGLELYRRLFAQMYDSSWKPRYICTESLPPQHEPLAQIAKNAGFRLHQTDDFIQLFTWSASKC